MPSELSRGAACAPENAIGVPGAGELATCMLAACVPLTCDAAAAVDIVAAGSAKRAALTPENWAPGNWAPENCAAYSPCVPENCAADSP